MIPFEEVVKFLIAHPLFNSITDTTHLNVLKCPLFFFGLSLYGSAKDVYFYLYIYVVNTFRHSCRKVVRSVAAGLPLFSLPHSLRCISIKTRKS